MFKCTQQLFIFKKKNKIYFVETGFACKFLKQYCFFPDYFISIGAKKLFFALKLNLVFAVSYG